MHTPADTSAAKAPAFPQPRTCPYEPPPGYDELRGAGPLTKVRLFDGREVWFVTGYTEARELLTDARLSADRTRPDYPVLAPRFAAAVARKLPLIAMDPPVHDVHRRLLNPDFSLKRSRTWRADVQRIVDECLDRMEAKGPPADLVPDLAVSVPSRVIALLLGVPDEDVPSFQDASRRLMQATQAESSQAAGAELTRYLDQLATAMRESGDGPGLMGRLATHEVAEGTLSHEELVQIALVLLVAGHETTASVISLGTVLLLEHPEQLARMRSDLDAVPAAVEELLRMLQVTDLAGARVAAEDIDIAGYTIRAGDGVLFSGTLANRDTRVHEEPDTFDVGRSGRSHLAFGYGIHQCIGQNLARLELDVVFSTLWRRLPGLRLALPVSELALRGTGTGTVQGVNSLPVTW
ncbi:cytochrome P450 [Streptomyces niveus]